MSLVTNGWITPLIESSKERENLIPQGIHIWMVNVPQSKSLIDLYSYVISSDEQIRASRFHKEKDQLRFLVSRIALRKLLAYYTRLQPDVLAFSLDDNKRPLLNTKEKDEVHFNISHSGDLILIALADSPIGVDIEFIKPSFHFADVLPTNFNTEEGVFVQNSKSPISSFFLLWTRKEALLKATAKGLVDDLKKIQSTDGAYQVDGDVIGSKEDWEVDSFYLSENYLGSIASIHGRKTIRFFDFASF
jgi:4'-phosphopantetheinyl transferase